MTLDELRDALEMAKLSARTDPPEAAIRNLLDWAEDVQQFLEITHGEPVETPCEYCGGHSHVCENDGPDQVWIICPNCDGRGKVKAPAPPKCPVLTAEQAAAQRPPCKACNGTGTVYEEGEGFVCSHCDGTGKQK